MLSDPAFPAFSAKVVPFMHVTTRIPDHKYDKLLIEKGFRGFPSLAFMDAKGDVVGKPLGRSVESFEKTLGALSALADLKTRMEAGEKGLEAEMLFAEQALGSVTPDDFKTRAAALEGLTAEQQAQVDQINVDIQVGVLAGGARRGGPGLEAAATAFLKMADAGTLPSKELGVMGPFWGTLSRWALQTQDAALARRVATGIRKYISGNEFFTKQADSLEETAGKLDALAALEKRIEAGEKGLAVESLILEYDLGKCKAETFVGKAEPLLAEATDAQKAELRQRIRETQFLKHLGRFPDAAAFAAAATALLALLGEDGQPPEDLARQVWPMLLRYGQQSGDPDLMARALNGMKKAYEGNPSIAGYAKGQEEVIAKLREKIAAEAEEAKAKDESDSEGDD